MILVEIYLSHEVAIKESLFLSIELDILRYIMIFQVETTHSIEARGEIPENPFGCIRAAPYSR